MKKICITPIRNEAWILDSFLKAASLWADIIIIADQNSDDGSLDIARKYNKVHLIENRSVEFNEPERQELLLNEARKFGDNNFILALDADEILSANFLYSKEWEDFFLNPPGTQMALKWANISPDLHSYWENFPHFIFGFIDDGSPKNSSIIHSPRIPVSNNKKTIYLKEIRLLHFQYAFYERLIVKHVWYQFHERIINPDKSILDIYEQYNHFRYTFKKKSSIPNEWLYSQNKNGFEIALIKDFSSFYWIELINNMVQEKGIQYFKNLYIWNDPVIKKFVKLPTSGKRLFYKYIYSFILYNYGKLPNRFYKRALKKIGDFFLSH
ncbi:MAG: glycosyltransferase family 2 protein [Sediminibacterium sp.]|nr:glycosyltransferase family 2 protein [Chitinophagaceae bacterium]